MNIQQKFKQFFQSQHYEQYSVSMNNHNVQNSNVYRPPSRLYTLSNNNLNFQKLYRDKVYDKT